MIFRNRRDDISFVEKENPYYLSFSDLMSGLLLIFILLTISLAINLIQKRKDLEKTRKKNFDRTSEIQKIIESIRKELNEEGIVVEIDKSILIIPEKEVGFESGSHDLDLKDKRTLNLIGSTIQKVLLKDDKFLILESIFVEGHTDSKKFSECYKIPSGRECVFDKDHDGNWELSVFRAISVLKHFEANRNLKKMMNLKNSNDEPLFAISGYSKTRPRIFDKKVLSDDRQRRINLRFNQKEAGLGNEISL